MPLRPRLDPRRLWRLLQTIQPLQQQVARQHKEIVRELRAIRRAAEQRHADLQRALAAHEQTLASLPELSARIERCVTAYEDDARSADRIASFHATVDPEDVRAHVRSAISRTALEPNPYPHLVVKNIFPDNVYDCLVQALPAPIFFDKVSEHRDEMSVPLTFAPAYSRLVWQLFHDVIEQAVLPAIIEAFRPALDEFVRTSWPTLESWNESEITLRLANPRLMLRRPGYLIKPHRDPRWAFLTALFYLSPRASAHAYGTQLYRMKVERDEPHTSPFWAHEDECELVQDVAGVANSALVFLNGTGAHGASIPADAPANLLRYVYQARFSPDSATKARLLDLVTTESRDRWVAVR